MSVVWKYPLNIGYNEFEMPAGSKILTAQVQVDNLLVLWALVEPNYPKITKRFRVIPTGFVEVDGDKYDYVATVQSGWLVYHVFQEKVNTNVPA